MDITRRHFMAGLIASGLGVASPFGLTATIRQTYPATLPSGIAKVGRNLSVASHSSATGQLFTFGELPPPAAIHKILSAGAPGDPLLLAMAPEKLLGLSSYELSHAGNEFLPESVRQLPKTGRLAGRGSSLSLEQLMVLKPDLIIDCGMTGETFRSLAARTVARTGIPWLLVDGGLRHSASQLRQLGTLLGVAERAELQAQLADRFLQDAQAFADRQPIALRFYSARGFNGLETGLQGSLHTEAAELLGMHNVARQQGQAHLVKVSLEQLLAWQPEVIITQDVRSWRHITSDPVWRGIQAVAQNQVLLFPRRPFGWLDAPPGVNRLAGLRMLQARFDQTVALTLQQDLREFFRLFYHCTPDDAQWQRLMSAQ